MSRLYLMVCLAGLMLWSASAALGDDGVGLEVTADFFSKYVWRGQNLVDDWVFQPGVSVSYEGFTASFWGNLDLTEENGSNGELREVDLGLDYSGAFAGIEVLGYSVGVVQYDFPVKGAADDTLEVYWGLNLDVPLNPHVTVYHDVDEAEGTYVLFGAVHSVERIAELAPDVPVGMEVGASVGWANSSYNRYYWGTDHGKANDLVLSASFPFEVAGWTVVPSVNYVTLLSDDIRNTDAYGSDSDFFFAGIGLVKEF